MANIRTLEPDVNTVNKVIEKLIDEIEKFFNRTHFGKRLWLPLPDSASMTERIGMKVLDGSRSGNECIRVLYERQDLISFCFYAVVDAPEYHRQ